MSETTSAHDPFRERLEAAVADGEINREALIEKVASLPAEAIGELPPSVLSLLGPSGLAAIASHRTAADETLSDLRAAAKTPPPAEPYDRPTDQGAETRSRHPMRNTCLMAAAVVVFGLVADVARPLAVAWLDGGSRPVAASAWPICRWLDATADGCVYVTGSSRLTLRRAAELLAMPSNGLARVNTHLAVPLDRPLPGESRLVVWRGIKKLMKGPSK